jgi:hypothetical protein
MEAMARYKPWTLQPGAQKSFYETYAKYNPPLTRQWFRGEQPEYLIPKAREARAKGGEVTAEGTKYWEPQEEAYFEEPAQPPMWTKKQLEEVNALANELYGVGESEDKTTFVRSQFGGKGPQRPLVGEQRLEEENEAEGEAERVMQENPNFTQLGPVQRMNAILSKMNPKNRAAYRRSGFTAATREEGLLGAEEQREETKRFHQEAEKNALTRTGIMSDREKRYAASMKFRQDMAMVKEKRLVESTKTAKGSKTPDAAIKAADIAYQNYLKEFRYEITANNKLQADFIKRAQAVGDTDFVPEYRNPMIERPMGYQEWLDSEEGYPYAQRVRELGGAKEGVKEGEVSTPPATRGNNGAVMDDIRKGLGLPLKKH